MEFPLFEFWSAVAVIVITAIVTARIADRG